MLHCYRYDALRSEFTLEKLVFYQKRIGTPISPGGSMQAFIDRLYTGILSSINHMLFLAIFWIVPVESESFNWYMGCAMVGELSSSGLYLPSSSLACLASFFCRGTLSSPTDLYC